MLDEFSFIFGHWFDNVSVLHNSDKFMWHCLPKLMLRHFQHMATNLCFFAMFGREKNHQKLNEWHAWKWIGIIKVWTFVILKGIYDQAPTSNRKLNFYRKILRFSHVFCLFCPLPGKLLKISTILLLISILCRFFLSYEKIWKHLINNWLHDLRNKIKRKHK